MQCNTCSITVGQQQVAAFLANLSAQLLIVFGPAASGKTRMCQAALRDANAEHHTVDADAAPDHKSLVQLVDNYAQMGASPFACMTVTMTAATNAPRPRVLLFDDFDILASQDRLASSCVLRALERHATIKAIVTCAAGEEKRLMELKKHTHHIVRLERACEPNHGQDRHLDCNIYGVVSHIFQHPQADLRELDADVSVDPQLIAYLMYDNAPSFVASMAPIRNAYCSTAAMEEHAYRTGDWGVLEATSLVRCGAVRLQQRATRSGSALPDLSHQEQTQQQQLGFSQVSARSAQRHCVLRKKAEVSLATGLSSAALLNLASATGVPTRPRGGAAARARPHPDDGDATHQLTAVVRTLAANVMGGVVTPPT